MTRASGKFDFIIKICKKQLPVVFVDRSGKRFFCFGNGITYISSDLQSNNWKSI